MKADKRLSLKKRAAAKIASRQADRQRLESGENPEVIQRENSIFPAGYFDRRQIINFSSAVGR
jgi:hypothetical protein